MKIQKVLSLKVARSFQHGCQVWPWVDPVNLGLNLQPQLRSHIIPVYFFLSRRNIGLWRFFHGKGLSRCTMLQGWPWTMVVRASEDSCPWWWGNFCNINLMRPSMPLTLLSSLCNSGIVEMGDNGVLRYWYCASYLMTVCWATNSHLRSIPCTISNCDLLSHPCRAVIIVSCGSIRNTVKCSWMSSAILSRKVCSSVTTCKICLKQESARWTVLSGSEALFLTMMSLSLRLGCCKIQETSAVVERFNPCSQLYSRIRLYMGDMEYPFSMLRRWFHVVPWSITLAEAGESTETGTTEMRGQFNVEGDSMWRAIQCRGRFNVEGEGMEGMFVIFGEEELECVAVLSLGIWEDWCGGWSCEVIAFEVVRGASLVGLLLQGESVRRDSGVVVEDFKLETFEDSFEDLKAPEKAGPPPLATGGVNFFGAW